LNSLETQVLRLIGENVSSPDVFTDDDTGLAQIRGSINDAIQEICMVSGSYRRTYHLALLQDRVFYRLAPQNDYLGYIVGCFDREKKRRLVRTDLLTLDQYDPWWLKRTGPALQYMQLGANHFAVYMAPSTKGIILELDCVMIPFPYTNQKDPVKVRAQFQNAAIYFAVSEFYASRGDAKRATEYHARYIETAGLSALSPLTADRQWRLGGQERVEPVIEVPA
jgi:hypothetical protein